MPKGVEYMSVVLSWQAASGVGPGGAVGWADGGGMSWSAVWEAVPWAAWLAPLVLIVLLSVVLWLQPALAVRCLMLLMSRSLLWLRVEGKRRLPRRGGVLLVCNPLSY